MKLFYTFNFPSRNVFCKSYLSEMSFTDLPECNVYRMSIYWVHTYQVYKHTSYYTGIIHYHTFKVEISVYYNIVDNKLYDIFTLLTHNCFIHESHLRLLYTYISYTSYKYLLLHTLNKSSNFPTVLHLLCIQSFK